MIGHSDFTTAYNDAWAKLGNPLATQDEINTAKTNLENAWNALKFTVNFHPSVDFSLVDTEKYGTESGDYPATIAVANQTESGYTYSKVVTGSAGERSYDYFYSNESEKYIDNKDVPVDTKEPGNGKVALFKDYYNFLYFSPDKTKECDQKDRYYITHGEEDNNRYEKGSSTFSKGVWMDNNLELYGVWEPNYYTVKFINPDGIYLCDPNPNQPADHKAYYDGDIPTYQTSTTQTGAYEFTGWINMNTGEFIPAISGHCLIDQYVYENTTYMACYKYNADQTKTYTVRFDADGDGKYTSASDIVKGGLHYYDKIYREISEVPYLQGEVFSSKEWLAWAAENETVAIDDNTLTLSAGSYAQTEESYTFTSGKDYTCSFDVKVESGDPTVTVEFGGKSVTSNGASVKNRVVTGVTGSTKIKISVSGGTAKISNLEIKCPDNALKDENVIKARCAAENEEYNPLKYDYVDPVWVNADNSDEKLQKNSRVVADGQSYVIEFTPKEISYTAKFVSSDKTDAFTYMKVEDGKTYDVANSANGLTETFNYTYEDGQKFPTCKDYADGAVNYVFQGWSENADGSGKLYQPGDPIDELDTDPIVFRSERTDKGGKTYYAVYKQDLKVYSVQFVYEKKVDGVITQVTEKFEAEYHTDAHVVVPADQITEKDDASYHYDFIGWDNINDNEGTIGGEYIPDLYTAIDSDAIYKPVYETTPYHYITFYNYSENINNAAFLKTVKVLDGEDLTVPTDVQSTVEASVPEKDDVYENNLSGWKTISGDVIPAEKTADGKIIPVTFENIKANATYYPYVTKDLRYFTVTFNAPKAIPSMPYVQSVQYGSSPASVVTVGGEEIELDTSKESSETLDYIFEGWDDRNTDIIERYTNEEIEKYTVHEDTFFDAIYGEYTRTYPAYFKTVTTLTLKDGEPDYSAAVYDTDHITGKAPRYYLGERISSPAKAPEAPVIEGIDPNRIRFDGWFTSSTVFTDETRLTRLTTADKERLVDGATDPKFVFYAHFVIDPVALTVTFFNSKTSSTPLYSGSFTGTNASSLAEVAESLLEKTDAGTQHNVFEKWLVKETDAVADLTNVTASIEVYASYKQEDHTWVIKTDENGNVLNDENGYVETKKATYDAAGLMSRTCSVCGHKDEKYSNRKKDTQSPTGQIVLKNDVSDVETLAITNEPFTSFDETNTVYVKGESVDVMINGRDDGTGVGSVQYFVSTTPLSEEELAAHDWSADKKTNARNLHFVQTLEELGDTNTFIVYAKVEDLAKTWDESEGYDKGEPIGEVTDQPNKILLTSFKVVFDTDEPAFDLNGETDHNEDYTAFCCVKKEDLSYDKPVALQVSDMYLRKVTVTFKGEGDPTEEEFTEIAFTPVDNGYIFTKEFTAKGDYEVRVEDKGGHITTVSFTIRDAHDFVLTETVEADCTTAGKEVWTCSVCGTKEDRNVVEAKGHHFLRVKDPDAEVKEYVDDYVKVLTTLPEGEALAGAYKLTVTKKAKCEAPGVEGHSDEVGTKELICLECGESFATVPIPPREHLYRRDAETSELIRDENSVAPTCTQPGIDRFTCRNEENEEYEACTYIKEEPVAPLGHDYRFTKNEDGSYEFEYTYDADAEGGFVQQIVKDEESGEDVVIYVPYTEGAEGQRYKKTVVCNGEVKANCTDDGYYIFYCSRCGEEEHISNGETAIGEHDYVVNEEYYPATCTTFGLAETKCSVCGDARYEVIDPLGHAYTEKVVIKDVTCTEDGSYKMVCVRCGLAECDAEGKEIVCPVAHEGHELDDTITVAPTCTEDGYTYQICSVCGEETEHTDIQPKFGHRFIENPEDVDYATYLVEYVESTYEKGGYIILECANGCGETKKIVLDPLAENTITFYAEGEKFDSIGVSADTYAVADIDIDDPVKTGYHFVEWVMMNGDEEIKLTDTITFTAEIKKVDLYAKFEANNYTVTWKDGLKNGDKTETLAYDQTITEYEPTGDDIPTKEKTDTHYYEFIGWTLTEGGVAIADYTDVKVTGDMTFLPVFEEKPLEFNVTFVDWDGNPVASFEKLTYGYKWDKEAKIPDKTTAMVTVGDEAQLLKDYKDTEDPKVTYTWTGAWEPTVQPVTMDVEYKAVYKATPTPINITFYLSEDATDPYLSQVYYADDTFVLPAGVAKEADDEFTYSFKEWAPAEDLSEDITAPVNGQAIGVTSDGFKYIASYEKTAITYTVTFAGETDEDDIYAEKVVVNKTKLDLTDTNVFTAEEKAALTAPTKGLDKPEDVGQYEYVFKGWKNKTKTYTVEELAALGVVSDMTFTPVFEKVYNKVTVLFAKPDKQADLETALAALDAAETDEDKAEALAAVKALCYAVNDVVYNTKISYKGATPLKKADVEFSYKYLGWNTDPAAKDKLGELGLAVPAEGKKNIIFYPIFEKTAKVYDITWSVFGKVFVTKVEGGKAVVFPEDDENAPSTDGEDYLSERASYVFKGWALEEGGELLASIPNATANVTYYAVFEETLAEYTANWYLDEETLLYSSASEENKLQYKQDMIYGLENDPSMEVPEADKLSYKYVFKGWIDDEENVIEGMPADNNFGQITRTPTNFYAQFDKQYFEYTATFYKLDATTIYSEKKDYHYGDAPVIPEDLENYDSEDGKFAYTFLGWATDKAAAEAEDLSEYKITADVEFYPVYKEEPITTVDISFIDYDDEVISEPKSYRNGTTVDVPVDPERAEDDTYTYTFLGWALSTDETATIVTPIPAASTADEVTEIIYKAVYQQTYKTFTLTFYTDDGKVISTSTGDHDGKYHFGDKANAPLPTKAETLTTTYEFAGWALTKGAAVEDIAYDKDAEIPVTADAAYYAVFTPKQKTYDVTFCYEVDGTPTTTEYKDVVYGTQVEIPETPVKAPEEGKTYVFDGWYNGKAKLSTVTGEDGKNYAIVTASVTYEARFSDTTASYTVYYYVKNSAGDETVYKNYTLAYGTEFPVPAAPADYQTNTTKYTFKGWDDMATVDTVEAYSAAEDAAEKLPAKVEGDRSFIAVFTEQERTYTVTFLDKSGKVFTETKDGVTTTYQQTLAYGAAFTAPTETAIPATNEKTYTFKGWSTDGETVLDLTGVTVDGDMTFKPIYEEALIQYFVSFFNGGTDITTGSGTYVYGQKPVVPNDPTAPTDSEPGIVYEFKGWALTATEAENETLYTSDNIPLITVESITDAENRQTNYYARFKETKIKYTVKFIIDNVTVYSKAYNYADALDTVGISAISTDKAAESAWIYTFKGWTDDPAEKVTPKYESTAKLLENAGTVKQAVNYYALYDRADRIYTINWYDENGTLMTGKDVAGKDIKTSYKYNEQIVAPAMLDKDPIEHVSQDVFAGWATDPESKIGESLTNSLVKSDKSYYAVYRTEYVTYKVVFMNADKVLYTYPSMKYNDSLADIKHPAIASKVETIGGVKWETTYTFEGWYTKADLTGVCYATSKLLPAVTESVTYYAKITENTQKFIEKYTVKFIYGENVKNVTVESGSPLLSKDIPSAAQIKRNPTEKYHYSFKMWTTDANPTDKSEGFASDELAGTVITGDVTYYAYYDHAEHDYKKDTAASYDCDRDGTSKTVMKCSVCSRTMESVGTANHDWVYNRTEPTYRYNGLITCYCARCSLKGEDQVIERLGVAVTFTVKDGDGNPIPGAYVAVYSGDTKIDEAVAGSDGKVTVYVSKDGTCELRVSASGYEAATGTISKNGANIGGLISTRCDCTCHKDTFWAKIYRFLYKILYSLFKVKCCDDMAGI